MTVIPVPVIDADGITMPEYATVHEAVRQLYRDIYGQDIYIEPDSQDGQLLAIFSLALHDAYSVAEATYNAFSPSTAQGVGLSRVVKINGIARHVPTLSSVDVRVVGQVGSVISNGVVRDEEERRWLLPPSVVIPVSGEITVTATASEVGAWEAGAGTVSTIATPTRGWQEASNPSPSTPGAPVELDSSLRARQTISTAIPSQTILDGIVGAVAAIPGVTRYTAYENDTDVANDDEMPGHSIAIMVDGGDDAAIAQTILLKKSPGTVTHGSTLVTVNDVFGIPHFVRFTRPTDVPILVAITYRPLPGFTTVIEERVKTRIAAWVNALKIGENVLLTRLYVPANLSDEADSHTYELLELLISRATGTPTLSDVEIAYDEAALVPVDPDTRVPLDGYVTMTPVLS